MTANESSVISLKLSNTTDGKISPTILVETSSPATAFEFTEHVELAAGESLSREWHVGPENLDLKRFIFARALVYSAYPFPDRETTCGIFILKLPGSGTVIAWGTILLSLLGMGGGLYGVYQARGPEQRGVDLAQQLTFLSLVVLLGLVTAFMGWWIFGILALVISLLFVLISAGILIGRSHA
ncbi:MAG: hypothetical protein HND47_03955 [Chloroflexi bacterium]|nr:hypothetical protein [Chloroflexota bacterium]